jgi:all-trans-8'-apo-beta-carotenal 15,15'-oxygenase
LAPPEFVIVTQALNRRNFLSASVLTGAAVLCPDKVLAGSAPAKWVIGVRDVEDDIAPTRLKLVSGRAPSGLIATLYRNGPAKFRRGETASGHWFDGDGLIRRFRIDESTAILDARFVDTPKRRLETRLGAIVQPGFGSARGTGAIVTGPDATNAANTSVQMFGGELMALWEAGSPTVIDRTTLESRGFKTFRPDLAQMPFLAHPRAEPDGTVWNLGGGGDKTIVWKLKPDGSLAAAELLKLERASYFHDFTATARHLVIVLQPWLQEAFAFPLASGMVWRPQLGTRVIVIDKSDLSRQRTFELPSFSFFHLGDAWEDNSGTIRFDGCLSSDPTFGQRSASALLIGKHIPAPQPILTQIVLYPNGRGELLTSKVDAEFPSSDHRRAGLPRRWTTHVAAHRGGLFAHGIATWDWQRGQQDLFDFGDDHLVEEFLFKPRGEAERDGWLIGTTLNLRARATELHIFDAANLSEGPVATWRADMPLPLGFHGTLLP